MNELTILIIAFYLIWCHISSSVEYDFSNKKDVSAAVYFLCKILSALGAGILFALLLML